MEEHGAISPSAAILAVLASFILLLFLGAAFYNLLGYSVAIVLSELLVIVVPLGYMLSKGVKIRSYIGLDARPRNILLGFTSGVVIFLFDIFLSFALVLIFGPSEVLEESNRLIMDMSKTIDGLILAIIGLSLAGICEEFTFRGFLQNAIHSKYSFGIAMLVSSLAFGFFHFDPQAVYTISAFLIGLLFGYIYHHWHSYAVAAVAHSTVNLIGLITLLLIA